MTDKLEDTMQINIIYAFVLNEYDMNMHLCISKLNTAL